MILTVRNVRWDPRFPSEAFREALVRECHATVRVLKDDWDQSVRFEITAPPEIVHRVAHFFLDDHGFDWHSDRSVA